MKRTILVVAVAAAIVLAMGAYAFAQTGNQTVTVNAQVNEAFSMTVANPAVNFGNVNVGALYANPGSAPVITVKSNRLYDYSAVETSVTAGAFTAPFSTFLTDTGTVAFGTGLARGVHADTRTIQLDLTQPAAYSIPASTAVNASITYTAVQN